MRELRTVRLTLMIVATPNNPLDRTVSSHSLATAGQRGRSAQKRRDRAATPHIGIQHHSVFVAVV